MDWGIVIVAGALLAVAAFSRWFSGTSVTTAMAFTAVGVLAGPLVIGDVDPSTRGEGVRTLAEATLALVLFSDASAVDLRALRRDPGLPVRLLGLGLPMTVLLGAAVAYLLFGGFSTAEFFVLAVALAPTDAALGQAVVTNERVPARLRRALNVESGLNDGICVPLLLIALTAAEAEAHLTGSNGAFRIVAEQIGYGVAGGLAAGAATAAVVIYAGRRRLIDQSWRPIIAVAGAFLAYATANALGGSGFIGAFVAGMTFGYLVRSAAEELLVFDENLGRLLSGVTWIVFGAVLLGPALEHLTLAIVAFGVLSLTAIRMIPVAVALIGSGVDGATTAFLGWFGPRGLASIVFAVIIVEDANLPNTSTLLTATYFTIGLSVLVHGLTAAPLSDRFGRRA